MSANLQHIQQAQGAVRRGHGPVSHFGDPHAEYAAAHESAAVFDLTGRTQLEIRGSDRQVFLNNFCTNNVKALRPGEGCEALVLNIKGRVLGHVFLFAGENALWLDSVEGASAFLLQHFGRYVITEDVTFDDATDRTGLFFIVGPTACALLNQVGITGSDRLPHCGHFAARLGNTPVAARRIDVLGLPGVQLVFPREAAADVWQSVTGAGIRPGGQDVLQTVRIEACFPHYGIDASDEHLAQELGRSQPAISFTKGCYLGQEPVARIDAMGHVNRELRSLRLECEEPPPSGSPIVEVGGDKQIGEITSSAVGWKDGAAVALAYLRSSFTEPGTTVCVQTSRGPVPATVSPLAPAAGP